MREHLRLSKTVIILVMRAHYHPSINWICSQKLIWLVLRKEIRTNTHTRKHNEDCYYYCTPSCSCCNYCVWRTRRTWNSLQVTNIVQVLTRLGSRYLQGSFATEAPALSSTKAPTTSMGTTPVASSGGVIISIDIESILVLVVLGLSFMLFLVHRNCCSRLNQFLFFNCCRWKEPVGTDVDAWYLPGHEDEETVPLTRLAKLDLLLKGWYKHAWDGHTKS